MCSVFDCGDQTFSSIGFAIPHSVDNKVHRQPTPINQVIFIRQKPKHILNMFSADLTFVRPSQAPVKKRKSGMVMEMRSWAEIERISQAKSLVKTVTKEITLDSRR